MGSGVYIHAERLLAKAGGSNCKPRGIPALAMERKQNGGGPSPYMALLWPWRMAYRTEIAS